MSDSSFESLEAVIQDESFPDTDLALRRGRHIGRDDPSYDFLVDAASHLEPLYRRFGCELVQRSDGYFYLLPSGDRLGRRHLSTAEMLVWARVADGLSGAGVHSIRLSLTLSGEICACMS